MLNHFGASSRYSIDAARKNLYGEHFSYNFLFENETTAHEKMPQKQNEFLYRDAKNGIKNRVLALQRLFLTIGRIFASKAFFYSG